MLKRIADDRKSLQEKMQTTSETSPPGAQGQKLGGKIQTNVDNNCILMVRQQRVKVSVCARNRFMLNLAFVFNADSAAVWRVHA